MENEIKNSEEQLGSNIRDCLDFDKNKHIRYTKKYIKKPLSTLFKIVENIQPVYILPDLASTTFTFHQNEIVSNTSYFLSDT